VLAVLPFTIDPSPGWEAADYTFAYGAVLDYLAAEKDKPNATTSADGGNPPVVSQTAAATHRVKATLLNIREFPWVGAVVPPIAGTLAQGAGVTVLGIYKTDAMPFGWGCISPDGNQWISMQWVDAI
jgi:hypothetical protein